MSFLQQPFEVLSTRFNASTNEIKLLFSFLLSYPLAGLLKRLPDEKPQWKNIFIICVSIFYLVGLFDFWDGLLTIFISASGVYIIANHFRGSPYMPWIGFVFVMGHLWVSFVRRYMAGDPSVDITSPQMVLVMKLSAFCWNVADGQLPEDQLSDFQRERAVKELPSLLDFSAYVLFFPSFFVGPAFDYAEYRRWLDTSMFDVPTHVDPAKKPPARKKRKIPRSGIPATMKAIAGLAWMGVHISLAGFYSRNVPLSGSFAKLGFFRRLWILYMRNMVERAKYYGIWFLSEGACILAGLGYNGVDPITGKVLWNRLQNVDPWAIETAQNFRAYVSAWNMNTNNWLRNYVYLRVTPRGKKPGARASIVTFTVSALWHGFYPGYYLCFLSSGLVQVASKDVRRYVRPFFLDPITGGPSSKKKYYDIITCLFTQMNFVFLMQPFLILDFEESMRAWSQLYFFTIFTAVASIIFFASPGKALLQRKLEKRQGKAKIKLTRSASSESLSGKDPILGIPQDPEKDIAEAAEELKAEIKALYKEKTP